MAFINFKRLREALDLFAHFERISGIKPPIIVRNIFLFLFGVFLAAITIAYVSRQASLPREQLWMLGIFVLAAWLWFTEAVPLFATAILIIGLEVLLLGNPGDWPGLGFTENKVAYQEFLLPLADPVIILFFGGFILALATVKEGVDKTLAVRLLQVFGNKPANVMFGIMFITAIFSMWMSNTATAAMMITLSMPLISQIPSHIAFRRGLMLSIPFAANLGGMGTPISSPPNAVAVAYLNQAGVYISFMEWFLVMMPVWLLLLLIAYALIIKKYPASKDQPVLKLEKSEIDGRGFFVIGIFAITVLLWLTDFFHGLPPAVVALIPPVVFTTTGLIKTEDIKGLDWHILLLIAGGIALGTGMQRTGLDHQVLQLLPQESPYLVIFLLILTLALSSFISNTAAANLIIPLALALSIAVDDLELRPVIIGVALMASCAMVLPVSTPPNAMAYAKGELRSGDFLAIGTLIAIAGLIIVTVYLRFISKIGLI
jgi:sodium-dependent dicarboxylate transporter 2/3/5